MRIRSTRTPEAPAPAGPPPRDSEALEHVLEALDAGVTGEADAHRRVVRALGEALELPYAAVWLAEPSGGFRLDSEYGRAGREAGARPAQRRDAARDLGPGAAGDRDPGGRRQHRRRARRRPAP